MMTYEFNSDLLNEKVQLFPDEIENDLWIVYHGTSSFFEEDIERDGFQWKPTQITKKDVSNIVEIYTKIDWCGNDPGGFQVLKPYSLDHDFRKGDVKPIFFGETAYHSLLFSTHEFAGGETVRSLRKAIQDLEDYLTNQSIRDTAMKYKLVEYNDLVSKNIKARKAPEDVDLSWLQTEVDKIQNVKEKCLELYNAYEYGVVYAIKFNKNDIKDQDNFEYDGSMGLKSFSRISSRKIVGKIHIPIDFIYPELSDMRRIDTLLGDGIIGKLDRREL